MAMPISSAMQPPRSTRHYRPAEALPTQLLDHATVCFEEQLYSQSFGLLSSALTAGQGSAGSSQPIAAHVPPVQHLALAATLAVHPSLTTRTKDKDKHVAADDALAYLRNVHAVVGVRGAELDKALQFVPRANVAPRNKRGKTKTRHLDLMAEDGDDEMASTRIRSAYAEKESLWTNAEDFWGVVGWAFNCSVQHKHRWATWKVSLAFMLDVLESDLDARTADSTVTDSMLAHYIRPIGEGRNNKRRLMRAILADGGPKSSPEFGEVWKNETKLPKTKKEDARAGKKRKLDLDNGEFGDYFDGSSDLDSPATSLPRSRSATALPTSRASRRPSGDEEDGEAEDSITCNPRTKSSQSSGVEAFGGIESIQLRQRLLSLLVRFCHNHPTPFLDTEDLFDLYTEFLRPLPLPVFQQLVLSPKRWLDTHAQSSLDQMLLRPLLASTAPAYLANALTQLDFETHYAPFTANTTSVTDNAKVSLLVEDLLRLLWMSGGLVYGAKLRKRVEAGIEARREKAAMDGRRKAGARARDDEDAGVVLGCSGDRMLVCLDMIGG
ncbi:hypothetical protein LTR36_007925 [Oleoguttula mirabilis]|uniref:Uncharacterized protein n=1 Tax=Oleoguttula mirabilis TaxID=1507867 RepID=A0AAV9J8Q1_9PEZI|nr:hypothetical protein LTR36_007925 [Oleoguttula mirabilis]